MQCNHDLWVHLHGANVSGRCRTCSACFELANEPETSSSSNVYCCSQTHAEVLHTMSLCCCVCTVQSMLMGQCRGRVTSIATGQGAVRRMHFAPPTCTQLDHVAGSLTSPNLSARVCCLFVNGTFGVWELDSRNELRAVSLCRVEAVMTRNVASVFVVACVPVRISVSAGILTDAISCLPAMPCCLKSLIGLEQQCSIYAW